MLMNTAKATPKKSPNTRKRPSWKVIVLTIGILIVSYIFVLPFLQKMYLRFTLSLAAQGEYQKIKESSAAKLAEVRKEKQDILQLSDPVYSAVYNLCYTDHNDSGWFANSYNYKCTLSYLDVYETTAVATPDKPYYNESPAKVKYISYDEYLRLMQLPARQTPSGYFRITTESIRSIDEVLNDSVTPNGVIAYAVYDAAQNRKLISERGSRTLDPQKRYVIIALGDEYMGKNIGCASNSFIFCESPIGN